MARRAHIVGTSPRRVERWLYGEWKVSGPGVSALGLRDRLTGWVLWFYMGEQFLGQWRPAETGPGSTVTRGLPLQGA